MFPDTLRYRKRDGGSDDGRGIKLFHMAFYPASGYPLYHPAGSHYRFCADCLLQENGAENGGGTVTHGGIEDTFRMAGQNASPWVIITSFLYQ